MQHSTTKDMNQCLYMLMQQSDWSRDSREDMYDNVNMLITIQKSGNILSKSHKMTCALFG